jgi:hypothetical protein
MTKKRSSRIAPYIWAATLIGAVSSVTSFAAERHSNASGKTVFSVGTQSSRSVRGRTTSERHPAGAAIGPTAKGAHAERSTQGIGGRQGLNGSAKGSEMPLGQGAVAKGVNPPPRDLNAIDTRGTVESHPKAPAKMQVIKIVPRHSPRPLPSVAPASGVSRDAIGVPVVRQAGTPPGGGEPLALRPSAPARSTAVGLAKVEPKGLPPAKLNVPFNSAGLNRATINGTRLTRPGFAASAVGGPATMVGGINGSMIRSKH